MTLPTSKRPDVAEGPPATPQATVLKCKKRGVGAPHTPLRRRFQWEKINDVTFKLASTTKSINVPASHGKWGGHRTAKVIAWVICVSRGKWLARYKDQACGPSPLHEAKAQALAMAKGAVGDYEIWDPVPHLNGLAAANAEEVW